MLIIDPSKADVKFDDFQYKFCKQICKNDGRRIKQICLHIDCISKWETAFYCGKCYEDHKQKNPLHINSLDYIEALPNALDHRIIKYVKANSIACEKYSKQVDELFNPFENYIMNCLLKCKDKVKEIVRQKSNNENLMNSILNIQEQLNVSQTKVLQNQDLNEQLKEYCYLIKENIDVLEPFIENIKNVTDEINHFLNIIQNNIVICQQSFQKYLDNIHLKDVESQINPNNELKSKTEGVTNINDGGDNKLNECIDLKPNNESNVLNQDIGWHKVQKQNSEIKLNLLDDPRLKNIEEATSITLSNYKNTICIISNCNNKLLEGNLDNSFIENAYKDMVTSTDKSNPPIHPLIGCNGCSLIPIVGPRYICSICNDFDYCEKCFLEKSHPHEFYKIDIIKS